MKMFFGKVKKRSRFAPGSLKRETGTKGLKAEMKVPVTVLNCPASLFIMPVTGQPAPVAGFTACGRKLPVLEYGLSKPVTGLIKRVKEEIATAAGVFRSATGERSTGQKSCIFSQADGTITKNHILWHNQANVLLR